MAGEAVDAAHPGHAWLKEHHHHARTVVVTALRQAQHDGTCAADAPVQRIAETLVALMDGLQLQWLMDPEGVDMAADVAAHVRDIRRLWELAT
jgi:hypothetical protein